MRNGITVRDVMNREFVGVSESDTLAEAADVMRSEPAEAAVVLRGNEPIGTISALTAMAALLDGDPETPVGELMEPPMPTVEPTSPLSTAAERLISRGVSHLLVLEADEAVGLLTERDVLAARESIEPTGAENDPIEPLAASGQPAETAVEGSTQSICEICGSLVPELADVNGQQVCADCRAY